MSQPITTPSLAQAIRMSLLLLGVTLPLFILFEWLLSLANDEPWSLSDFRSSSVPFLVGLLGVDAAMMWWPRRKLRWHPQGLAEGETVYEKALVYRHWQRKSQHELMVLTNRRLIFTDTKSDPWEVPISEVYVRSLRNDWRPGLRKTVLRYQGHNLILDGWTPQTDLLPMAEGVSF